MSEEKVVAENDKETIKPIEWFKMTCADVSVKIKEIKTHLMTTKMSKQERNRIEKDLESGEKYFQNYCKVKHTELKSIDIKKTADKPKEEVGKRQMKSIGVPPNIVKREDFVEQNKSREESREEARRERREAEQNEKPLKAIPILPTEQRQEAKGELPVLKLVFILGFIGGAIYFLSRKKQ